MIKIVNVEGPICDPETFQPCLRVTADFLREVSTVGRTEQENALILYTAWTKAFEEWNQNTAHVLKEA
jgi:hypothetical protein